MTDAFRIIHQDTAGAARTGVLSTTHGHIPTPNFMPVATRGVFHGFEMDDARDIGVEVIMCNTFHLSREVGAEVVAAQGGLHAWTGWSKPIATDSGGFQVFSYGWSRRHGIMKMPGGINASNATHDERGQSLVTIDDDGVTFTEGEKVLRLTPEESIRLQELLGADILFAFDEPTSPMHDRAYNQAALGRTEAWAKRCLTTRTRRDQLLLGVLQGGPFQDLRERAAQTLGQLPFDGYAIGGSYEAGGAAAAVRWQAPFLPEQKVRHVLGIGWVKDIIRAVDAGADLFDCVEPIRRARHRNVLIDGVYKDIVPVARARGDQPLAVNCDCPTCRWMSAETVKALLKSGGHAGGRALAIHNVRTMVRLMNEIRQAITSGEWTDYRQAWLTKLFGNEKRDILQA